MSLNDLDGVNVNFCCGKNKLPNFINVDVEPSVNPDKVFDVKDSPLPFENNSVDRIVFTHAIEHIEEVYHVPILCEFHRILKPDGILVISYPEFEVCANNFITNKHGRRDYWKCTLYGRQLYKSDYHVTPMVTAEFKESVKFAGFYSLFIFPEPNQPHNTVIKARKGTQWLTYEELLAKEIFGVL